MLAPGWRQINGRWHFLHGAGATSNRYACSPSHGPRITAHGPLLQRRETRLADGFPVTRSVLLQ